MSRPASLSFEFFPPKTEDLERQLWETVSLLSSYRPDFVSVTYGAGGSTRDRTHAIVAAMAKDTLLKPAAHLTCVGASCADVDAVIAAYHDAGVRHIVALRGDPAEGVGHAYVPHPEGYKSTADLVKGILALGDFEVSVSAYPEKHPESASMDEDMHWLEAKWRAGAKRAISQFFFTPDVFLRYRDLASAKGIDVEIVPGLIPIHNMKQVSGFAARCGTHVPLSLIERFQALDGQPEAQQDLAVEVFVDLSQALLREGIDHLHVYTLNRGPLVVRLLEALGFSQDLPVAAA